jgi:hypothetical protein
MKMPIEAHDQLDLANRLPGPAGDLGGRQAGSGERPQLRVALDHLRIGLGVRCSGGSRQVGNRDQGGFLPSITAPGRALAK